MANTSQAKKRARQADAQRDHASSQRSALRKEIRKFRTNLSSSTDRAEFSVVQGHLARAGQKNLIPKQRANRIIKRLAAALKRSATA
jgi:small subunit ribosomal protein S20|tara:strand:- start:1423 stop:1683 length:261 start_codon:yes stop_codon:yes gene_type:complete